MKIIIDAGHGYTTPGKRTPDGMKEFEFNRDVAIFTKKKLESKGAAVFFTHSDHEDVPLAKRVSQANNWKADLFLSIHANAYGSGWNSANGIETFIHTSRPKQAEALAKAIQHRLIQLTGRKNRGVKTADFYVLRKTAMSAVLIEAGFMTNLEEARLLRTLSYRELCAKAIAEAVESLYQLPVC
ncbi:N-acetylmuramoyl-L-alanine amidase [Bacillus aerolatus]|uniref:N-acetylmuramoyl-L-alanine amidase n=1 Tax=Bacillus aerolatus TaxID=2653354 RepID=A0A6I1FEW0_9BACI|nr:N-acetylmuramoyl-L-alanine amidase [Bacillus aerolatus]KAB7706475.1 N-acetylmuramoyl-L-alanine amidase [Bacillus aerolatus]